MVMYRGFGVVWYTSNTMLESRLKISRCDVIFYHTPDSLQCCVEFHLIPQHTHKTFNRAGLPAYFIFSFMNIITKKYTFNLIIK